MSAVSSTTMYSPLPSPTAWGLWLTFISRAVESRAVEDFIMGGLLTHVGRTLYRAWLPFPHFCLDYSTPFGDCQALFLFFLAGPVGFILFLPLICPRAGAQPQAPFGGGVRSRTCLLWRYHFQSVSEPAPLTVFIVSQVVPFVKPLFKSFSTFFYRRSPSPFWAAP